MKTGRSVPQATQLGYNSTTWIGVWRKKNTKNASNVLTLWTGTWQQPETWNEILNVLLPNLIVIHPVWTMQELFSEPAGGSVLSYSLQ